MYTDVSEVRTASIIRAPRLEVVRTSEMSVYFLILFDEAYKYGDGEKCWGYLDTNTEPLCV
jgi:hypothetical protein